MEGADYLVCRKCSSGTSGGKMAEAIQPCKVGLIDSPILLTATLKSVALTVYVMHTYRG